MQTALGMIETIGLVSALEAADAGLKAAHVRLLGTDYVRGGLVMVRFEGEVAAVQAAIAAGSAAARRIGHVFSSHVIPRAMPEVICMLASDVSQGPGKRYRDGCENCRGCEGGKRETANSKQENLKENTATLPSLEEFSAWKVLQMRQFVRKLPRFPLTPGEIRYANRQSLLAALTQWFAKEEEHL